MIEKETGDMVTLSNDLARATYQLTVNEMRLLLLAFAKMPKGNSVDNRLADAYYITKQDVRRFDIDPKNIMRSMKLACDNLHKRTIEIYDVAGKGTVLKTYWIHNIIWYNNHPEYIARVVVHPDIIPYVYQLTTAFLKLKITDLTNFKSFYSFRIYIMLMQWQNNGDGTVNIKLDEFRKALCIENKYTKITDLKVNVLDRAVSEINSYTPYTVGYALKGETGKSGRGVRVSSIEFHIDNTDVEPQQVLLEDDTSNPLGLDFLFKEGLAELASAGVAF